MADFDLRDALLHDRDFQVEDENGDAYSLRDAILHDEARELDPDAAEGGDDPIDLRDAWIHDFGGTITEADGGGGGDGGIPFATDLVADFNERELTGGTQLDLGGGDIRQTVWPNQATNTTTDDPMLLFHSGASLSTAGTFTLTLDATPLTIDFDATTGDLVTALEGVVGAGNVEVTDTEFFPYNPLARIEAALFWVMFTANAPTAITSDLSGLTQGDGPGLDTILYVTTAASDAYVDPFDGSTTANAFAVGSDAYGSTLTARNADETRLSFFVRPGETFTLYYLWVVGDDAKNDGSEICPVSFHVQPFGPLYVDAYLYDGDRASSYLLDVASQQDQHHGGPQRGDAILATEVWKLPNPQHGEARFEGVALTPQVSTFDAAFAFAKELYGWLIGNYPGGGYCGAGRWPRFMLYKGDHDASEQLAVREYVRDWAAENGITVQLYDDDSNPI